MDRLSRAVDRLWGSVGMTGRLHDRPRFADDLARQCNGKLALQSPMVSKWPFGYQVEHLYRASHYVLDRLEEAMSGANANEPMGPWGMALMVSGFIPRGMFPTIPQLVPEGGTMEIIQPIKDSLQERLANIPWDLADVRASDGKSKHPRMKWLTASQWMLFADVHHRHHLRILQDIVETAPR